MFFPSKYEGFGLVTIECLAAGVPVLGYDVGAVGDFYHSALKGVALISDNMDETLNIAKKLADLCTDMSVRKELYQNMYEKYSYEIYKEKLKSLLDNTD